MKKATDQITIFVFNSDYVKIERYFVLFVSGPSDAQVSQFLIQLLRKTFSFFIKIYLNKWIQFFRDFIYRRAQRRATCMVSDLRELDYE